MSRRYRNTAAILAASLLPGHEHWSVSIRFALNYFFGTFLLYLSLPDYPRPPTLFGIHFLLIQIPDFPITISPRLQCRDSSFIANILSVILNYCPAQTIDSERDPNAAWWVTKNRYEPQHSFFLVTDTINKSCVAFMHFPAATTPKSGSWSAPVTPLPFGNYLDSSIPPLTRLQNPFAVRIGRYSPDLIVEQKIPIL